MLRLNARTINPLSGLVLAAAWTGAATLAGAAFGALGGRAWRIARGDAGDGAAFVSTVTVGHLLLPLGFGPVLGVVLLALRMLRRVLFPRHSRLDRLALFALVVATSEALVPDAGALPPRALPLRAGTPAPGAMPVSVTVHPPAPFPEVTAWHAKFAPLASDEPGRAAALRTGRLPLRTGAGPSHPRAVPGGGGIARIPTRPGARVLAHAFPVVTRLEGTPFEPVGDVEAIARSAGVPVLASWPDAADPPLYLRWLEMDAAPDTAQARALMDTGAWVDVERDADGGGEIALGGRGIANGPAEEDVSVLDVVPTVLHLLGLAVPRECDGRVLRERLATPGPGERAVRYRPLTAADRSSGAGAGAGSPVSVETTSR